MNKNTLNQLIAMSMNFAVLISVIILIVELRQNHEYTIAQTRNDISEQALNLIYYRGSSDFAPILLKYRNGEELTDLESLRMDSQRAVLLQMFENQVFQYSKGLYSEEEFSTQVNRMANADAGMLEFYRSSREGYAPSLRVIMDEYIQ